MRSPQNYNFQLLLVHNAPAPPTLSSQLPPPSSHRTDQPHFTTPSINHSNCPHFQLDWAKEGVRLAERAMHTPCALVVQQHNIAKTPGFEPYAWYRHDNQNGRFSS